MGYRLKCLDAGKRIIVMDLSGTGGAMRGLNASDTRLGTRDLVSTVMNRKIPQDVGKFWSS